MTLKIRLTVYSKPLTLIVKPLPKKKKNHQKSPNDCLYFVDNFGLKCIMGVL